MSERILIVEDEQKISRVLQLELDYEGYETIVAANGKQALEYIEAEEWGLILLDIMILN